MRYFKLILSEKRGDIIKDEAYEKLLIAESRNRAYEKALIFVKSTFFKDSCLKNGIEPDDEMIFWTVKDYDAVWINGIEEIELI